jgi:hypothetical protein
MVWTYFDSLWRLVNRIPTLTHSGEQKDEIVLAIILSVASIEVFVNIYFRVLVIDPNLKQHEQLILNDLDAAQPGGPKGLDYKLRNWPPKVLGKSCAWQTGIARDFTELREKRNA